MRVMIERGERQGEKESLHGLWYHQQVGYETLVQTRDAQVQLFYARHLYLEFENLQVPLPTYNE